MSRRWIGVLAAAALAGLTTVAAPVISVDNTTSGLPVSPDRLQPLRTTAAPMARAAAYFKNLGLTVPPLLSAILCPS